MPCYIFYALFNQITTAEHRAPPNGSPAKVEIGSAANRHYFLRQ
jgi:hypothetical protein